MGVAELSSLPLAFVDLFKYFPKVRVRDSSTQAARFFIHVRPSHTSLSLALLLATHTKQVKAHFPITNEAVRNVFAVSFLWVRGFYWPYCSIAFWRTQLAIFAAQAAAAASATARKPAPPPLLQTPTIYTFLACNVLMTGLQWYWASIILTAIWRLVTGDPRHKDA